MLELDLYSIRIGESRNEKSVIITAATVLQLILHSNIFKNNLNIK